MTMGADPWTLDAGFQTTTGIYTFSTDGATYTAAIYGSDGTYTAYLAGGGYGVWGTNGTQSGALGTYDSLSVYASHNLGDGTYTLTVGSDPWTLDAKLSTTGLSTDNFLEWYWESDGDIYVNDIYSNGQVYTNAVNPPAGQGYSGQLTIGDRFFDVTGNASFYVGTINSWEPDGDLNTTGDFNAGGFAVIGNGLNMFQGLSAGDINVSGKAYVQSGGSNGKVVCWNGTQLGYCSDAPAGDGSCTCN
jgi:hypothetical protein